MMATNFEMKTFLSTQATIKGHITNSLDELCTEAVSMDLMTYGEMGGIQEGNKHRQCTNFLEHFGLKIKATPEVFYQFTKLLGGLRTCDGVVKRLSRWLNVSNRRLLNRGKNALSHSRE